MPAQEVEITATQWDTLNSYITEIRQKMVDINTKMDNVKSTLTTINGHEDKLQEYLARYFDGVYTP